jgi:uncharacterized protein YbjT (DUF2867 family)
MAVLLLNPAFAQHSSGSSGSGGGYGFSGKSIGIAVGAAAGAYTGAASDAELRTITVDYAVKFARVLHASSSGAAFSFLSGSGADPTSRSRMSFARYKGEVEKASLAAGFPRVYVFRPAYIYP